MTIDPAPACEACEDHGFMWLRVIEWHSGHWRNKDGSAGFAVVKRRTKFRAPCLCAQGTRWLEARRRGRELDAEANEGD